MPQFIGKMYYEEVENNEEYDRNFNLQIKWEEATDPACKKGEVFKQEPAAGSIVQKGASVTLFVNGVVLTPAIWNSMKRGSQDTTRIRFVYGWKGAVLRFTRSTKTMPISRPNM